MTATTIMVRASDGSVKRRLRVRAAGNERSMEAEVRDMSERAVAGEEPEHGDLAQLIHGDVLAAGADFSGVFEGVRRGENPRAAAFGGEGVGIARRREPVARPVPVGAAREFDVFPGECGDEVLNPLSAEELRDWEA
jgi:plasmid stability protein